MTRAALVLLALAGCCPAPAPEPVPPGPSTVRGTVKLRGTPPKPRLIRGNGEPGFPAGGILQDDLVVDAEGKVHWAFVYVRTGLEGKSFPPPQEAAALDLRDWMVAPHVLGVRVEQPVVLTNRDRRLHFPQVPAQQCRGMPSSDESQILRFQQPSIMEPIRCHVHPWMRGWIGVLDHPFFAVTDEAGRFELKNLPAGKYTIGVWHERVAVDDQEIEVNGDVSLNLVGVLK